MAALEQKSFKSEKSVSPEIATERVIGPAAPDLSPEVLRAAADMHAGTQENTMIALSSTLGSITPGAAQSLSAAQIKKLNR